MVGAIQEITINQGVDPRGSAIIGGGGAAGLNMAMIGQALGCPRILIPRTAGALSAFGGQYSDIVYEASASVYTDSAAFDFDSVERAFATIWQSLDEFGSTLSGRMLDIRRERFLEARYSNQSWTIELPLGDRALTDAQEVERVVEEFHDLHERIFAVRDPGQPVEVLLCRGRLVARPFTPALADAVKPTRNGHTRGRRIAYFPGLGLTEVPLLEGETLGPGSELTGPLLVTEPTTTVVVPPGVTLRTTASCNYVLELT
jgi:N-methylhydantoinase A